MMAKSKKNKTQEPAYKVLLQPKEDLDEDQMFPGKAESQTMRRESAYKHYNNQNEHELGESRSSSQYRNKKNELSQQSSTDRPQGRGNKKPSTTPAKSLMSIDFSGMEGSRSSSISEGIRYRPSRSTSSSDDFSPTERRRDWRIGRSRDESNQPRGEDSGSWRRSLPPQTSPVPLIVDMKPRLGVGVDQRAHQPSLLGDYWSTQHAAGPGNLMSLMDITPTHRIRPGGFNSIHGGGGRGMHGGPARPERRIPQPSIQDAPLPALVVSQRNTALNNDGRQVEPRKRAHQPSLGRESPEQKVMKTEEKPQATKSSNKVVACKGNGRWFLVIPASCLTTYVHGRAKVSVVYGDVSILSYRLKAMTQYDLFSPTSGSLLALNCEDTNRLTADEVRKVLSKMNITEGEKELASIGDTTVAIIMMDKLDSIMCDYVTSISPYTQLFTAPQGRGKEAHHASGVVLPSLGIKVAPLQEMVSTCLTNSKEYDDVLEKFTAQLEIRDTIPPVWLCCGAKNSGKSTFCRRLINTALQSVDVVGYIDCDVGQTEFSPPGTLSFHLIKKPVLGQPFCHQRRAERMAFYGDVAASQSPSIYVKCLKHVLEAYREMEKRPPLIVNTMGFPEGIGLMLMVDTVQLVRPDVVVQLESLNQAINFPAITREMVALEEGWTTNKQTVDDPSAKVESTYPHKLILLTSLIDPRRGGNGPHPIHSIKLKPVDLRNLSMLSALTLDLEASLTLTSMPPLVVPFRQLALHICHHAGLSAQDVLAAFDVSVVALCAADLSQAHKKDDNMPYMFKDMPICDCLGLGIVRAIDEKKGLLYLTTTLPRKKLTQVNTLLKGSLSVPDQIILKQKPQGCEPVPYVDALAPSTGVAAVRPRARMPRITLGAGVNV